MKRFLVEFSAFVLIIAVIFGAYFWRLHQHIWHTDRYELVYADKNKLLEKTHDERRIVLIGGSNVAFGVDSKMIADSLGMTVVNYGINVGIGLRLVLNGAKSRLKSGDYVVVMPEYQNFFGKRYYGGGTSLPVFAIGFPETVVGFNSEQLRLLFKYLGKSAQDINKYPIYDSQDKDRHPIYSRFNFDNNGDEVAHLSDDRKFELLETGIIRDDFSETITDEAVNDMIELEKMGCKVVWLPPCVYDKWFVSNKFKVSSLRDYINSRGLNFCYGFDEEDNTFIEDEMYDSHYHLNKKGRERNTLRIIKYISPIFS